MAGPALADPVLKSGENHTRAVTLRGWMSAREFVGVYGDIRLTVTNTGPKIPHLLIALSGQEGKMDMVGYWRYPRPFGKGGGSENGIPINDGDPHRQIWDFGPLAAHKTAWIMLSVNPTVTGNYAMEADVTTPKDKTGLRTQISDISFYGTIAR